LFAELVSNVQISGKTCLLCHAKPHCDFPTSDDIVGTGYIDVWWVFDLFPANGLLLLMPFLLQQHKVWKNTTTRLFVVATPETDLDELHALLQGMVDAGGMRVTVEVLHMETVDAPRFAENAKVMHSSSKSRTGPRAHKSHAAMQEFGRDMNGPDNPGGEVTVKKAVKLGSMTVVRGESSQEVKDEEVGDGKPSVSKKKPPTKKRPSVDNIDTDAEGSKMTGLLAENSGDSPLVILTMPRRAPDQPALDWVKSVTALISGLKRVILIQESGKEKIQFFSE
jgi:potassium/chloride transporter 4/5/6